MSIPEISQDNIDSKVFVSIGKKSVVWEIKHNKSGKRTFVNYIFGLHICIHWKSVKGLFTRYQIDLFCYFTD